MEEKLNKLFFNKVNEGFLEDKEFEFVIKSGSSDMHKIKLDGWKYHYFNTPTTNKNINMRLKNRFAYQGFSFCNTLSNNDESNLKNKLSMVLPIGKLTFEQLASNISTMHKLGVNYSLKNETFDIKTGIDWEKSPRSIDAWLSSDMKIPISKAALRFKLLQYFAGMHQVGFNLSASLTNLGFKNSEFFYALLKEKSRLVAVYYMDSKVTDKKTGCIGIYYTRDPTLNSGFSFKFNHNLVSKYTLFEYIKHHKFDENMWLKAKVNSDFHIGVCAVYEVSKLLKLTHSAEVDLRKYFSMEQNYKLGFKFELNV